MDINARLEIVLAPEVTALLMRIADALTSERFAVNSTSDAVEALNALRASSEFSPDNRTKPTVEQSMQTEMERRTQTTEEPASRKRRGRPPGSGKTAEEQTQALEQQAYPAPAPTPAPAPAAAIPPGMAVPPGVTMPPSAVTPVAPAMPNGAQHVQEGGTASLDDLRACVVAANQKNNKTAFKVLRAKTWADGTPKDTWFTIESVPAELRERVIEEMTQSLL